MALTVEQQPASIALARNPMWVKLETDNYVTTAGDNFFAELDFSGTGPDEDDTIQFVWPDNESDYTFTFKDAPDDSGTQIPTNVGLISLSAYLVLLAGAFRAHYYLNETFTFTPNATQIIVTARDTGTQFVIIFTISATNLALGDSGGAVDEVARDNFQIILDVYVEDAFASGTYARVAELDGVPDAANQCEWDIYDILLAHLAPDKPVIGDGATLCSNILKNYYLRYGESYGDPATVQFLYNGALATRQALMAGVRFDAFPATTFLADHITATEERKFLTTVPRSLSPLYALPAQQVWLYYYNDLTTGTLTIRATIYYSDSSNSTQDIEVIASPQAGVYVFPAGHDQLSLDSYTPAKAILSWDIWVEHSGGNSSEVLTYMLDRRRHQHVKYFLFQNSAGGMDTLACTGEQEERLQVKAEAVEVYVGNGYTGSDAQLSEAENEYTDVYSVATGLKTADYIRYLRDLMLSTHVYEITDAGLRRIILDRDKMSLVNTEDDTQGLVLVYRYAYDNCAYSQ